MKFNWIINRKWFLHDIKGPVQLLIYPALSQMMKAKMESHASVITRALIVWINQHYIKYPWDIPVYLPDSNSGSIGVIVPSVLIADNLHCSYDLYMAAHQQMLGKLKFCPSYLWCIAINKDYCGSHYCNGVFRRKIGMDYAWSTCKGSAQMGIAMIRVS